MRLDRYDVSLDHGVDLEVYAYLEPYDDVTGIPEHIEVERIQTATGGRFCPSQAELDEIEHKIKEQI